MYYVDPNLIRSAKPIIIDMDIDHHKCRRRRRRRRSLWIEGILSSNLFCDEQEEDTTLEWFNRRIDKNNVWKNSFNHRSCYFTQYSMFYNISSKEWIFSPKSNIYNNADTLKLKKKHKYLSKYDLINYTNSMNIKLSQNFASKWNLYLDVNDTVKTINSDLIYYEDITTILGIHTTSPENPGHVIFDDYFVALKMANNFVECGIDNSTKINLFWLQDTGNNFDDTIGNAIFENIKIFNDYIVNIQQKYNNKYKIIGFKDIIVGAANLRGLQTGVHLNQFVYKLMRRRILNYYNISPWFVPNKICVLIIKKSKSLSQHKYPNINWPLNYDDMILWINNTDTYNYLNLEIYTMDPLYNNMTQQIELISKSCIIISLWGGGSTMNFLQPLRCTEIIFAGWVPRHSYIKKNYPGVIIPDFDGPLRDALSTHVTLRYYDYTQNNKGEKFVIRKELFMPLFDIAFEIATNNLNIH